MQSDDEPIDDDFDAEDEIDAEAEIDPEGEIDNFLTSTGEADRKRRNAEAYEIRRRLEDLQDQRRSDALFDDLD